MRAIHRQVSGIFRLLYTRKEGRVNTFK